MFGLLWYCGDLISMHVTYDIVRPGLTLLTASLVLCHIMNNGTMLGVHGELCGLLGGATLLAV